MLNPLSEHTAHGDAPPASDAPGTNPSSPERHCPPGEKNPSAAQQEMLCAMHELTDALLDLNDHLRSLSTMLLEDTAIAGEKSMSDARCVSDYNAAGAPFGPDTEARGIWHLFRQVTTDN